jgi:hypothetical protein
MERSIAEIYVHNELDEGIFALAWLVLPNKEDVSHFTQMH